MSTGSEDHAGKVVSNNLGEVYELAQRLGGGGEAQVYRAIVLEDGSEAAIKVFAPGRTDLLGTVMASKVRDQVFKHLPRSDHLVRIRRWDRLGAPHPRGESVPNDERWEYCVMDLVRGIPLDQAVKTQSRVDLRPVATAARGIAELHRCSLVHGDIKPSNIVVEITGWAGAVGRVVDLGAARLIGDPPEPVGIASPPYTSPRQRTEPAAPPHDAYALAMTALFCVIGRPPDRAAPDEALEQARRLFGDAVAGMLERALQHDLGDQPIDEPFAALDVDVSRPSRGQALPGPGRGRPSRSTQQSPPPSPAVGVAAPDLARARSPRVGPPPPRGGQGPPPPVGPPPAPVPGPPGPEDGGPAEVDLEAIIPAHWPARDRAVFRALVWLGDAVNFRYALGVVSLLGALVGVVVVRLVTA